MKRLLLVALLASLTGAAQTFALGLGAEVGAPYSSTGVGTNAAITFKLDRSPYLFALGAAGSKDGFTLGATADYWMAQGRLIDFLGWYAGPGLFLNLTTGGQAGIDVGLRIPVGVNAFLLNKKLELFLELAPTLGLAVNPFQFPTLGLQNALGFRFWF